MSTHMIAALAAFAFVSSITPGPNNLMLMASGANFGLRRTVPHMLGVALGFVFMTVVLGAGLAQAFDLWPALHTALKVGAMVYMLWLAAKIARAAAPEAVAGAAAEVAEARPFTFLQAAGFQWVNPKAWAMATTAIAAYAPTGGMAGVVTVAAVFGAVNLPSITTWAVLGRQMRRVLTSHRRLRIFNVTMAALLVASLGPILMG